MKKIAYLLVAFSFFGVVALSSCKSKTAEAPAVESTIIEEAPVAVDSISADTAAVQ